MDNSKSPNAKNLVREIWKLASATTDPALKPVFKELLIIYQSRYFCAKSSSYLDADEIIQCREDLYAFVSEVADHFGLSDREVYSFLGVGD